VSKKLFIPAICLQLFVSCSEARKEQRGQLWIFSSANIGTGNLDEKLSPVSFLWLAKNGSYTRDFGNFEHGSYKKAGDSLILLNNEGKTTSYIMSSNEKLLRLTLNPTTIFTFESTPLNESDSLANPFLPVYNKWRIKPSAKESDKLITERLINHCSFWQAYFTWAYKNEIPSIDVRSLPTPIKIYSNGFTLKPVTKKWARYFFNNEDAFRSNEILENVIRNNKIVWPETKEKYALFISAFQQLHVFLKQAMATQST
jgi:hypothetical protein